MDFILTHFTVAADATTKTAMASTWTGQTAEIGPATPIPVRTMPKTTTTAPHAESPRRPRPSNQQTETVAGSDAAVCLFYAKGMCKSALKCKRLHRRVPIKSAAASGATVCNFYILEQGCNRGELCEFRHFVLPP